MRGALSPADRERLDALFELAAELSDSEQAAFVEQECGSNPALRDELAGLLAGLTGEDILGRMQTGTASRAWTVIDRYKVLERIGHGGMGEVYAAQQLEPIVRRVTLKIIRPEMDSREILARFEAERQAPARMAHPNIAQVYDGATTSDGRPYFVMEYVAGEPVTEYCDRRKIAARERLELFLEICAEVQHAHQKGVIHRDLKPSNLMVTQQDGRAVPKIIDFGVARATTGHLTERTTARTPEPFVRRGPRARPSYRAHGTRDRRRPATRRRCAGLGGMKTREAHGRLRVRRPGPTSTSRRAPGVPSELGERPMKGTFIVERVVDLRAVIGA